jgi:hypothetical protein
MADLSASRVRQYLAELRDRRRDLPLLDTAAIVLDWLIPQKERKGKKALAATP